MTPSSFSKTEADSTMEFANHGCAHFYDINDNTKVCCVTFEPGWNWKTDVQPMDMFKEWDSCQMEHMGYCIEGAMKVTMNDGTVMNIKKGDIFHILPGHDASTDVLTRMIDFHPNWKD